MQDAKKFRAMYLRNNATGRECGYKVELREREREREREARKVPMSKIPDREGFRPNGSSDVAAALLTAKLRLILHLFDEYRLRYPASFPLDIEKLLQTRITI